MPRKLTSEMTLDTLESEAMFTLSMLRADPNTSDLTSLAIPWQSQVDAVRASEQQFRQLEADTDAARIVANQYLDSTCTRFGDELLLACGKDRASARWTRFFTVPVSEFNKQALARQVSIVQSWLTVTDDVLEKYRKELDQWAQQCDAALVNTDAVTVKRRDVWAAREQLAVELTRERDALHRKLSERAEERGLGRTWADLFFRVESRKSSSAPTS